MSARAVRVTSADQAQRDRALDPARSFIVQAPAGSGKTSLLVARFLKLLESAGQPEEILAITFTRKAAAEMKKRVLAALGDRAAQVAHRLKIETIDAFCMSLARQLPVLAKFGAPPGIAEDARELYREAAVRAVSDFGNPQVARLLSHLDNDVGKAAALVAAMLAKRDQWLRKTGHAPTRAELEAAFAAEREQLIDRAFLLDPRASPEFADSVLTQKGGWRKRPKPAPADIVGNEPLRLALIALQKLPPERYSDPQWEALEAMLALLPLAAAELKLVFAARGQCDFTEIAQGAVRALGTPDEPTDLLLALDHRIRHILLDEFQDTSISQWELLERLTAGWQPDDGRTLFVVGDPMQSIYRFREAEVQLFGKAQREGLPNVKLESLALTTNFRSQAGLVEWVNETFTHLLPRQWDEMSGAVPYSPATPDPAKPVLPGQATLWHAPADTADEAETIVDLVRGVEGDCAILVRSRTALAEIVPALKAAGIRYRAIEIEKLGEKQVVQDLYALTRALTHLADRVAWFAILRAPWAGLGLQQLSAGFEGRKETVWEVVQEIPSLERFRAVLAPALTDRLRGTLRDRVEGVWLALGGPACVGDATDLEDAEVYLDALEALEDAGEVDFARLAELLDELYALPDVAATERDLQIMTIHKAKGLEFGTVIVPGLQRGPGKGDAPLMRWRELPDRSLLLAPIKETGAGDEPAYEYLKRLDREAEDTEATRLLYVAATRAKQRLHLFACPRKTMPPKRSLLECAWPVAQDVYGELVPPERADPGTATRAPTVLRSLAADWQMPVTPLSAAWTAPPDASSVDEEIEFSWARETARHVGTVVHRWLQRMAQDALQGWTPARVEDLRAHFAQELKRRGVQPSECAAAAGVVAEALTRTLADDRGRWLLGPHPEAASEYRLRAWRNGMLSTHIIDRLIRDADGTRWVVDFKTSRHEGADVEAFLDRERERYTGQLRRYLGVVGEARAGLYFPLLQGWRALD
jgi:ATP-dependent exoDNAse (exonuclease V) beta subunit